MYRYDLLLDALASRADRPASWADAAPWAGAQTGAPKARWSFVLAALGIVLLAVG